MSTINKFLEIVSKDGGIELLKAMVEVSDSQNIDLTVMAEKEDFVNGTLYGIEVAYKLIKSGFKFKEN